MAVIPVNPSTPEPATIARAAALLGQGRLVAFPTETVYGLGANALDPAAVNRIYEAKGRPGYNPLIVHVADAATARRLVTAWPDAAERLAARWWPGPVTLVLPKSREVPPEVTAGLSTVALRVPAHPVALALLKAAGVPVAAPSANRSGEVSPTTAEHVLRSLGDRVPMILDAGPTTIGIESTVIDLSDRTPTLLRPGMVTREELESLIGPVEVAAPVAEVGTYAPKARVLLFREPSEVETQAGQTRTKGGKVAALVRTAHFRGADFQEQLPNDPSAYAKELYGALHRLDRQNPALIVIERPPTGPEWAGIRDRLARAAHG
jgi:L-threonylcarbamoyladenylate synthase